MLVHVSAQPTWRDHSPRILRGWKLDSIDGLDFALQTDCVGLARSVGYIEKNFGLASLGTRDATANDFFDCFDYFQSPSAFTPIQTSASVETLLREAPTGSPDDD
jgi:hypothetical protein